MPCTFEFVIVMLLQLIPTAVPAFITAPDFAMVQYFPVLLLTVESMIESVPEKSLLVKKIPPPKAFVPAALFVIVVPQMKMLAAMPSL